MLSEQVFEAPFVGSEFPEGDYRRLCTLLLERRGFDLSRYKDRCIKRRVASRVRACGYHAAEPYLERLVRDEAELDALLTTLVINVSQFFRNPGTFRVIGERILPQLAEEALAAQRPLILWSVGCASGEEPYSLALLVAELAPRYPGLEVEIVATDVSAAALKQAREGIYEETRLAEVPARMRERYFSPAGRGYRLEAAIRHRVRFRHGDILVAGNDPQARLILCRNVLIYLSRPEQDRILRRFAGVLGAGGYLALGRAETLLGEIRPLFAPEYPVERIYRCSPAASAGHR